MRRREEERRGERKRKIGETRKRSKGERGGWKKKGDCLWRIIDVFPSGCRSECVIALECFFLRLSHVPFIYHELSLHVISYR